MADTDLYRRLQEASAARQEELLALGIGGSTRRSGPTKTVDEAYADMVRLGLGPKPRVQPVQREQPEEAPLGNDVNIYAALTGAPPSRRESQGAVADALRRRGRIGEIALLSGDPSLQSFGQHLTSQADSQAEALQRNRQAGIDDARAQEYQDAQRAQWETQADEGQRQNTMQFLTSLQNASQMTEGSGGGGARGLAPKPLTGEERKLVIKARDYNSALNNMDDFLNGKITLKDGSPINMGDPQTVPLKKFASQYGVESENTKELAKAFAAFDIAWTYAKRHDLFGATLTDHEKSSWGAVAPSSTWTLERLQDTIGQMKDKGLWDMDSLLTSMAAGGKNVDEMARLVGAHPDSLEEPTAASDNAKRRTGGGEKSLDDMSDDEQRALLEELEAEEAARGN